MEDKLKLVWTMAIPLSFFCAGIHHIAYWSEFNINGLAFLELGDIVKSFIQPFLYTSIINIIIQAAVFVTTSTVVTRDREITISTKKIKLFRITLGIYLILVVIISCIPLNLSKINAIFFPFIYAPLVAVFLYRLLSPYINNRNILTHIISFSMLLPFYLFPRASLKHY